MCVVMELTYHGCTGLTPPTIDSTAPSFAPVEQFLLLCPCLFLFILLLSLSATTKGVSALGSMSTISISSGRDGVQVRVCILLQGTQSIQCWSSDNNSVAEPSPMGVLFLGISGGRDIFCGIRADTGRPFCWDTGNIALPKRLKNDAFADIAVGEVHVCALSRSAVGGTTGTISSCWRNESIIASVPRSQSFISLASGADFTCGLTDSDRLAQCWGSTLVSRTPNASFQSLQAGSHHVCGLTEAFNVQCWGDNTFGQQRPPQGSQFLSLALGERHSCGIDAFSRNVVCWGDAAFNRTASPTGLTFAAIAAGDSVTCGLLYPNSSVYCWGGAIFGKGMLLPLNSSIPSVCTSANCSSGSFQLQGAICAVTGQHACMMCRIGCSNSFQAGLCQAQQDISCTSLGPSVAPAENPSFAPGPIQTIEVFPSRLSKGLIALIVLGSVGLLCGALAVGWFVWIKFGDPLGITFDGSQGRVHNSTGGSLAPPSMRRQRSSTSSLRSRGEAGRCQAFTQAEMDAATMGFSDENQIGAGSFGIVYKGILPNGREVAIKRGERETVANDKKNEEKESAFRSELELLSRLHHKHLVSLVGYCDEGDERMLVYDYMPNGTLHDHLHRRSLGSGHEGALPWQMRIKIALEAARGVEYLHTYAVPPIIHRDIKSSNILLDSGWSARVSDFGLSTHGPGENSHLSLMAAGTLGYMDPEYYRLQHLTIKSDVYSFGVVLLELITGERAIHKQSHGPVNIVDYALPRIENGNFVTILDQRSVAPTPNELKAVEIIAQLAVKCVQLEGKERPTMTEIVTVLEEAMLFSTSVLSLNYSSIGGMSLEAIRIIPDSSHDADDDDGEGKDGDGDDHAILPLETMRVAEDSDLDAGDGDGRSQDDNRDKGSVQEGNSEPIERHRRDGDN